MKERWQVRFSGKVQHVGFRYTTYYIAKSLYLTGWVDNLPSGDVLMEVQGETTQLRKLLLQLKQQPNLFIQKMEIKEIPVLPFDRKFKVKGYD
ncbi:MAG: acylphosphatase [Erysipelotrichaceae bacterium]|nr:acylphosphatase [Erysipelotrichaceae bacterium]